MWRTSQQRHAKLYSIPFPNQCNDNISRFWHQQHLTRDWSEARLRKESGGICPMKKDERSSLADKFINCLACLKLMCSGQNLEVCMSNALSGGTTYVKCLQQFHCHLPCQACHFLQTAKATLFALFQVCPMVLLAHHNLIPGKYRLLCVPVRISTSGFRLYYINAYSLHLFSTLN